MSIDKKLKDIQIDFDIPLEGGDKYHVAFPMPDDAIKLIKQVMADYYLGLLPDERSTTSDVLPITPVREAARAIGYNRAISEMAERIKNGAE